MWYESAESLSRLYFDSKHILVLTVEGLTSALNYKNGCGLKKVIVSTSKCNVS